MYYYYSSDNTKQTFLKRPAVSVIITLANAETTLKTCIGSVLAQTYKNFEIITVDNDPTDKVAHQLASYDDPRIISIQERRQGPTGAINAGIRQARGRYIAILDTKDSWHPNKLEKHVGHLDRRKEVGVSYSASSLVDEQGYSLGLCHRPQTRGVSARNMFERNPVGTLSTAIIRREVLDQISFVRPESHGHYGQQYFDERFAFAADRECWLRIALTTDWRFEGLDAVLGRTCICRSEVSAGCEAMPGQPAATRGGHPVEFSTVWKNKACAIHFHHLARRAVLTRDMAAATRLLERVLARDLSARFLTSFLNNACRDRGQTHYSEEDQHAPFAPSDALTAA